CDSKGRVEFWSPGAASMFGVSSAEMIGADVARLIPTGPLEQFQEIFAAAAAGTASGIFRTIGQHANGQLIDLSVSLAPMGSGDAVRAVAVIARDVSERRRNEEREQRDREELVEREAALRRALTALRASHEELKNTQLQLIQAAKLDSIGRLAAGVAH